MMRDYYEHLNAHIGNNKYLGTCLVCFYCLFIVNRLGWVYTFMCTKIAYIVYIVYVDKDTYSFFHFLNYF